MEAPDLWSSQAGSAEQSHIDSPGSNVEQFKAMNSCNPHFCWLNIYELDLTPDQIYEWGCS